MSGRRIAVVGDAMLDRDLTGDVERICPDAPVPVVDVREEVASAGGAGRTACLLAAAGAEVHLVTALARDGAGDVLRAALEQAGVTVHAVAAQGTTIEKVRVRAAGQSLVRLDRGTACTPPDCDVRASALAALRSCDAIVVSDYGRGMTTARSVRAAVGARPARRPLVWDPHPRSTSPIEGATLVTPNEREASAYAASSPTAGIVGLAEVAMQLVTQWRSAAVAVTLGPRGAMLAVPGSAPLMVPTEPVPRCDPCGAGDAFAGFATLALAGGAVLSEAVVAGVEGARRVLAERSAGDHGHMRRPRGSLRSATDVVAAVRAAGGTVVATGGCFDLLHAGHIGTLAAARRLGDCLVVLVNSDASVRALKGPDRPLQTQDDRTRILAALDCVDAVEVFDEATPVRALRDLRPDVFVKGGDYDGAAIPERAELASWSGEVVVVPYLAGRSTTRLVEEARHRART